MMLYGFKRFHPLKGQHPQSSCWHGRDIVGRARKLLNSRTLKEIKAAMKIVNWLADHPIVRDESFRRLEEMAKRIDNEVEDLGKAKSRNTTQSVKTQAEHNEPFARNDNSSSFALLLCKTQVDISNYDEFS